MSEEDPRGANRGLFLYVEKNHVKLNNTKETTLLLFSSSSPVHDPRFFASYARDESRQHRGHRGCLRTHGHAQHDPIRSKQVRSQGHDGVALH